MKYLNTNGDSILVIFTSDLPKKNQSWWQQFDFVVASTRLKSVIDNHGLTFIDIETLLDPGSVQEASGLIARLPLLENHDGRRISKLVNYHGYELWWVNYDNLMYKFCLPYTQYRRLLEYLETFLMIYLYEPPFPNLFRHFLDAHKCQYTIKPENKFEKRLPLGILLQVILSVPFLLWLKIRNPKLMVWTSDKFDPPRDHDFRMRLIYEELRRKNINFVEFIRSMESSSTVLLHALKRRRPVIYSYAIVTIVRALANFFSKKSRDGVAGLFLSAETSAEQKFWFFVATNYLHNTRGDILTIQVMKFILKFIGIKAAIISMATNRNFSEVLACKLLGISTIGIQHGAALRYYAVADFMEQFDGEKKLSVDKYGLWSEWWRQYYLKNSKAYKLEQLFVSGPMRPLEDRGILTQTPALREDRVKVLFVPGQLAEPEETIRYLCSLLETKDLAIYITFRPYHDSFERWMKESKPEILEKIGGERILRGSIHDAIAWCDIVVGSNSTGVLEALLQLKPLVFFYTNKWRDYFELESLESVHPFFVRTPRELVEVIRRSRNVPVEILKELQNRFFGDPHLNGSKWVVEQAEKFL